MDGFVDKDKKLTKLHALASIRKQQGTLICKHQAFCIFAKTYMRLV